MRALMRHFQGRVDEVIAVDATSEALIDSAVGSLRYRVRIKTPGGHSYQAFGNESAIHRAARIIRGLYAMQVPRTPRTTFNVGTIEGGTSVNSIAQHCAFTLDLRSSDAGCLQRLNRAAMQCIRAEEAQDVQVDIESIGERPCGREIRNTALVDRVLAIRERIGLPLKRAAGSTDCNLPLSMGIPSVCLGVYTGHGAHSLEEYIQADSIPLGLQQLLCLFLDAGDV